MTDYGRDMSCVEDLTPTFAVVSGRRLLAEALARRLITRLGSLRRHPMYGYDVREELNDDLGPGDLARISAGVNAQFLRDQRVEQSACTATLGSDGTLTIAGTVTDGAGPFPLVLSVGSVTVQLVEPAP